MKKTLALILVLAMVFAMAVSSVAFADEAAGPAAPKDGVLKPEDITIAFAVFQDDQYYNIMTQGAKAAAEKYGVRILTSNFNNDAATELEKLTTYIGQGVNGIVWNSADGSSLSVLKEAANSGIPVAFTSPLDGIDLTPFVGMFSNDQKSLGYNCGNNAAPIIKDKFGDETVKVAVLQFASQSAVYSADRVDNFLLGLEENGIKYEVVADQDAWLSDTALEATQDILSAHPDVDVIFGGNDGASVGATLGVKNAGLAGKVIVCGIDASLQLLEMVRSDDDILQVCAGQNPYVTGYDGVEQVIKVLTGGFDKEECSQYYGKYVVMDTMDLVRTDPEGLQAYEDFMHGLGVEG